MASRSSATISTTSGLLYGFASPISAADPGVAGNGSHVAASSCRGRRSALADGSSRRRRTPARTSAKVEKKVLAARNRRKRGAVVLAAELGMNPSTVGRILARNGVPHLAAVDPITGERSRSSRRSENRYEHPKPGAGSTSM